MENLFKLLHILAVIVWVGGVLTVNVGYGTLWVAWGIAAIVLSLAIDPRDQRRAAPARCGRPSR
jgi:hypothetical protein